MIDLNNIDWFYIACVTAIIIIAISSVIFVKKFEERCNQSVQQAKELEEYYKKKNEEMLKMLEERELK